MSDGFYSHVFQTKLERFKKKAPDIRKRANRRRTISRILSKYTLTPTEKKTLLHTTYQRLKPKQNQKKLCSCGRLLKSKEPYTNGCKQCLGNLRIRNSKKRWSELRGIMYWDCLQGEASPFDEVSPFDQEVHHILKLVGSHSTL